MSDHEKFSAEYRKLLNTLKEVLKSKEMTYALLAAKVGVSQVSIKRWLSGKGCTLENIFEICEAVDISFFDLTALAKEEEEVDYVLSAEQEKIFSKKPALFGFFKELHGGKKPTQLAQIWNLTSAQIFNVLHELERMGLLEVHASERIRLKSRGNIRYSHQGPLAKVIFRPHIDKFLDHIDLVLKNKDVCLHSAEVEISEAHIKEFVAAIHKLGAKYRIQALRDKSLLPSKKLKAVRWLFAFAPYRTNWLEYNLFP